MGRINYSVKTAAMLLDEQVLFIPSSNNPIWILGGSISVWLNIPQKCPQLVVRYLEAPFWALFSSHCKECTSLSPFLKEFKSFLCFANNLNIYLLI